MSRQHISIILALAGTIFSGCSQSNIKSDWSCPIDQPEGCLDITDGDEIAIDALADNAGKTKTPLTRLRVERTPTNDSAPVKPTNLTHSSRLDDKTSSSNNDMSGLATGDPQDTSIQGTSVQDTSVQGTSVQGTAIQDMSVQGVSAMPVIETDTSNTDSRVAQLRIAERLAEVWLGAFEDEQGNYHPATRMFIVVQPAKWRTP